MVGVRQVSVDGRSLAAERLAARGGESGCEPALPPLVKARTERLLAAGLMGVRRCADTVFVAYQTRSSLYVPGGDFGRSRPVEYALASASSNSRIAHAVLETEERTMCGRDFDVELTDYRKPGDLGGEEPNCRVCRESLRRRAAALQGGMRRKLPRMGCRHCGSLNFRHAVRRRAVDRCSIRLGKDGELVYDLDEAPRTRVESTEITCSGCRRPVTEKDLVRGIYAPRKNALSRPRIKKTRPVKTGA